MFEERRPGLSLLALGLLLGLLADATLRAAPWGLNATVTAVAVLAVMLALQGRHQPWSAGSAACVLAAVAAAAGFLWRDAVVLKVLNALVLAVAIALLAAERHGQTAVPTLSGYATRLATTIIHAIYGTPVLVACDIRWSDLRLVSLLSFLLALARGVMLAAPVLLVFGVLLTSADAIFAARLAALLDIDLPWLAGHAAGTFVCAWVLSGLLRAAVRRETAVPELPPRPDWLGIGLIEIVVLLGLLDLLFAGFVWVQLRCLFGGVEWVQAIGGLSYAEYARRGFFELVAVAALVLPLLLVAHWLLQPGRRRAALVFGGLAGVQIVLVLVMLVSVLERMRLYREEYGLTQLRFYTTAFMLWLGLLLVWFVATVLRGRRGAFARGAVVSAGLALASLHAVDPERRIFETNRLHPRGFDVAYARTLGADALPELLAEVPHLEGDLQRDVAREILDRWTSPEAGDWRRWSFPRARARRLVLAAEPSLRAVAAPRQASR